MIDVHCHFDIVKNPELYIANNENNKIVTIGMTNLPSHFQMGVNKIKNYRYIRLALGLHPLLAKDHEKEYLKFKQCINETSYIGEVGLDFSREGITTKEVQIESFEFVLNCIEGKRKLLSLHSRRAEQETFSMLVDRNIENAIFHWYSGSLSILNKIVSKGYFFSINSAMIQSENGKRIISQIPRELILTETDIPFIENSNINSIYKYLSISWDVSEFDVEKIIDENFRRLLMKIR